MVELQTQFKMKKIYGLIIPIVLFAFISCGDNGEKTSKEDLLSDAKKLETGVYTPLDYNDGLVSEISLLQVAYAKVDQMMQEDAFDLNNDSFFERYNKAHQNFVNECMRIKSVLNKLSPIGERGTEYKEISIQCVDAYASLGELIDAENLKEIINTQNELQYSSIDMAYMIVDQSENTYIEMNRNYAIANGITLGEAVDIDELAKE